MDCTTFTLQEGNENDADEIYRIHTSAIREVCSSHYGAKEIELWTGKLSRETYIPFLKNQEIIVAKEGGALVGFIHHIEHSSENNNCKTDQKLPEIKVEIKGLFIDPAFIKRGLGRLLVGTVESLAKQKGAGCLTVSASLNSVQFYNKLGFHEVMRKAHQITCQCTVQCVCMIKKT